MSAAPAFRRLPDPAAGVRAYSAAQDGRELGTVTNRRGGWWRAITPAGELAGSWHSTRKLAAAALVRAAELEAELAAARAAELAGEQLQLDV